MSDVPCEAQQSKRIPSFSNDVLFDAFQFLRRNEHARVRLTCRRLFWLSKAASKRFPARVVDALLEVRGVYALPAANGVPRVEAACPRIVANSMRVNPPSADSYWADFPAVEPPEDIIRLSELEINDFIGPELLQFLRVSARLLDGCWMVFTDFHNFVGHHSPAFISRFFALFPSNRTVELRRLSSLAIPLFLDHPAMFGRTELGVECLDTFPLDALQEWLHLDEQEPPEQQKKRSLDIRFAEEVHVGHSIASVGLFVQRLKQRFLNSTSCCPFLVEIELLGGPHIPELDPFVENNEGTGEQLAFNRDHHQIYTIERRRKENGQEAEEEGSETGEKTTQMYETVVYIREMVQGDKLDSTEDQEVAKCRV